ncbi:hypothetical protein [Pelagicoccus sp. SDUM812005]|uniref:5' nucleotidase, NT5C type n=1 Tax=Pelagicoccus sp. SDUM812005 TaxID=3041257 RepID=UPI00280D42AE|nr:hypothetical protein [Pelagicoccus sp. SDUM812005]MDQ8181881.1 hypothetical protein [Pelagicoccus sp. SDUM812005]
MELQDIKQAHRRAHELKAPKLFESILDDLQKLSPKDAQNFLGAKLTRMDCYFMLERWVDLIGYSGRIIESTPEESPLEYLWLARGLSTKGRYEKAKSTLNDSLEIWPDDLETIILLKSLSESEIAEGTMASTDTKQSEKVAYADMDNVFRDYGSDRETKQEPEPDTRPLQNEPDFFRSLKPGKGAIDAVNELRQEYQVYTLIAPSARNPESRNEKGIWVEEHLDLEFTNKLITYPNKTLMTGGYLIGDHADGKWQENPERTLVHFGTKHCPEWDTDPKRFKIRKPC